MNRFGFSICLLSAFVLVSCRQSDVRTAEISVPEMKNNACAQLVVNAIGKQVGVRTNNIEVDLGRRMIVFKYDSLVLARKNLEFAIAEAGFRANDVPANLEAAKALPPECR